MQVPIWGEQPRQCFTGMWGELEIREAVALLPPPAGRARVSPHPVVSMALGRGTLGGRGNGKIGIKPRSTCEILPVLPNPLRVRFAGEDRGAHPPELGMAVGAPALLPRVSVFHHAVTTGSPASAWPACHGDPASGMGWQAGGYSLHLFQSRKYIGKPPRTPPRRRCY